MPDVTSSPKYSNKHAIAMRETCAIIARSPAMNDDSAHFREMADRCVRMARSNPRADQTRLLLDLAEEYRSKAEAIEREAEADEDP